MKHLRNFLHWVRKHQQLIYTAVCIGIVYSLVLWTLLNSILCFVLAGFWLLFTPKDFNISPYRKKQILLYTSFFLITIIGLAYTSNTGEGFRRVEQRAPLLMFPIIFGITPVLTSRLVRKLLIHFLIAVLIACVAGIASGFIKYLRTQDIQMLSGANLLIFQGVYAYIMGLFCLLSIMICWYLLPSVSSFKVKGLLMAAALVLSLMIILLGTRLIIAGWLITLLFIGFRLIKSLILRLVTLGALLAIVAIAIATLPLLKGQWNELKDFSSGNTIQLDQDASLGRGWGGKAIRFALWQCSKDVISRHWLTGVGTGDVQDSLQMAYEQRKFYFASRYNRYNAHNQYIQTFVGHGIAGFLLLVLSIGIPLFSKKPKEYSLLYTYFLLLFAGICCTEVILDTNKGIVWYSFINSIFAFTQPENRT